MLPRILFYFFFFVTGKVNHKLTTQQAELFLFPHFPLLPFEGENESLESAQVFRAH